jgi:hypothetical protein
LKSLAKCCVQLMHSSRCCLLAISMQGDPVELVVNGLWFVLRSARPFHAKSSCGSVFEDATFT